MVDALRRARGWLRPAFGCVIDLRPAHIVPVVEFGLPDGTRSRIGALVVDDDRRQRHMAADLAVLAAVKHDLLSVEAEEEFAFFRYPASADELRQCVATKRQQARLDDATYERAIHALRERPDGQLWLREQVGIRVLRPV